MILIEPSGRNVDLLTQCGAIFRGMLATAGPKTCATDMLLQLSMTDASNGYFCWMLLMLLMTDGYDGY